MKSLKDVTGPVIKLAWYGVMIGVGMMVLGLLAGMLLSFS